jgi:ABC-type bacteriocin/lantibiotic exporter with double-glycine peptidase domain
MNTQLTLGDVEPYQQIHPYSCGAAALKAVLGHWGEEADEPSLIKEIGVDPKSGSTCYQVESAARQRGYMAQTRQFRSIDELMTFTEQDIPVILAIQSFTRPGQGHFVVAADVDGNDVEIMDPNVRGNWRTLTRAELDKRWKFRDRVGVVVLPPDGQLRGVKPLRRPRGLGDASKSRTVIIALVALAAVAAVTTGVVIYRRRRAA